MMKSIVTKKFIASLFLMQAILLAACSPAEAKNPTITPFPLQTNTPAYQPLIEELAPILQGQGVPEAAEFDPDSTSPHKFIILNETGNLHRWNDELPSDWLPSTLSETELVVVVEEQEVNLGSQAYTGGPAITRYRYEMDVKVCEARNGEILLSRTLKGTNPEPFPKTAPKQQTRLTGGHVTFADFEQSVLSEEGLVLGLHSTCWTIVDQELGDNSIRALSPDGQLLVTDKRDASLYLWRVADGSLLNTFEGHSGSAVMGIAFSPDGQLLASGAVGEFRLWQVSNGELLHTMVGKPGNYISSLTFSPDGQTLATNWSGLAVVTWDVSTGEGQQVLVNGYGSSLTFSPDGQILVSGMRDNSIGLYRVSDGQLLLTFAGHTGRVTSLAFSPDGKMLASASAEEMTTRLWDVENGALLQTITYHTSLLTSIAYSPDGQLLATGAAGEVCIWRVEDGSLLHSLWRHTGNVTHIAFSADGKTMNTASKDAVCQWKIQE